MTPKAVSFDAPCPCGRPGKLAECCGPYLTGERQAPDPESLMRSRYTAFALGTAEAVDHLVATHHADHRASDLRAGLQDSIAGVDSWERLEVRTASEDGERGSVEFTATYRVGKDRMQLRERSQFVREEGRWFYTRGQIG